MVYNLRNCIHVAPRPCVWDCHVPRCPACYMHRLHRPAASTCASRGQHRLKRGRAHQPAPAPLPAPAPARGRHTAGCSNACSRPSKSVAPQPAQHVHCICSRHSRVPLLLPASSGAATQTAARCTAPAGQHGQLGQQQLWQPAAVLLAAQGRGCAAALGSAASSACS
jgi:hypothetical protein